MDEQAEARAITGAGPLQHLEVAVGIPRGEDRAATDMLVDADRLALLVVDEVELGHLDDHRLAVSDLVLGLDAGSHDLLGRHAVGFLGEDAEEIDAAAGDDEGLEVIGAEVGQ